MTDVGASNDPGDNGTISLLRRIESGIVDPKSLAVPDRRQLVGFLMADGYSTAEMGQILQFADRTIERDKKAVRESNAIARDPQLVEQMVGRLVTEAELAIQRIRRAVRERGVLPAVKVDGEHRCYQIVSDLIRSLRRLGYLPTATQKVEADLTHHVGEVPDLEDLHVEVRRLIKIHHETGEPDPNTKEQLVLLERQIAQADLATRVDQVSSQILDTEGKPDDTE